MIIQLESKNLSLENEARALQNTVLAQQKTISILQEERSRLGHKMVTKAYVLAGKVKRKGKRS